MWTEIIPQLSGYFKDEAISPKTCFVPSSLKEHRHVDHVSCGQCWQIRERQWPGDWQNSHMEEPGSWSDIRRHSWPTNLKWLLRERKRNAHLFLLPRFFFTSVYNLSWHNYTNLGRIRHEINWLPFTRDSYLLERLGVIEPCPPPPASSRPHLSGINSG